jgi:hypothetical protein
MMVYLFRHSVGKVVMSFRLPRISPLPVATTTQHDHNHHHPYLSPSHFSLPLFLSPTHTALPPGPPPFSGPDTTSFKVSPRAGVRDVWSNSRARCDSQDGAWEVGSTRSSFFPQQAQLHVSASPRLPNSTSVYTSPYIPPRRVCAPHPSIAYRVAVSVISSPPINLHPLRAH